MSSAESSFRGLQAAALHIALAATVFLLWWIREGLLLAFGSILAAIILRVIADWIARMTRASDGIALTAAILLVIAIFGATLWLFGSHMSAEFSDVLHRLQDASGKIKSMLQQGGIGNVINEMEQKVPSLIGTSVASGLSSGTRILEGVLVLVIAAIYLAASPELYYRGAVLLFPARMREWARETLDVMGRALKQWFIGEFILMVVVGVLSALALWLLGVPGPLALGLIAGTAEIVPYLGPFIGGIPAVMIALTQGVGLALWTAGAYILIHLFEGYVVSPIVQRRLITIPPVLILFGFVVMELIFGPFGLIFAAPLTAAIFVAVKRFYLRDVLGRPVDDVLGKTKL